MVRGSQVALKHVIHDMETRTLVMELRRCAIKRCVPCGDMDRRLKILHSPKVECGFRIIPEEYLYDSGLYNQPFKLQYRASEYNTIQCNTIQYNTIQYNTIQYNTIQYNTIQYNTIQYNTIQYNTIQYNTIQYNTIQYNTIQYNTIQYNTIQYNTIQYNTKKCMDRWGEVIFRDLEFQSVSIVNMFVSCMY